MLKVDLCDQPGAGCLTASEAAAAPVATQLRVRKGLTDVQARAVFDQYKTTKARRRFHVHRCSPTLRLCANAFQCQGCLLYTSVFKAEELEVVKRDACSGRRSGQRARKRPAGVLPGLAWRFTGGRSCGSPTYYSRLL